MRDDGGTPGDASDDTWTLQTELAPPTGDIGSFGKSVSLDGNWLAVGDSSGHTAPGGSSPHQGFVRMARRDDGGTSDPRDDQWVNEDLLLPGADGAHFGAMVDLCGEELLVFGLQPLGTGRIFRFRLDVAGTPEDPADDTWIENGEIQPPPGEAGLHGVVARDGNSLLIGGSEVAYEYRLDDAGTPDDRLDDDWVFAGMLKASDDTQYDDDFGTALSLRGGRALVGAKKHGDFDSGAAYLFQRQESGTSPIGRWMEVVKLTPPAGTGARNFGDAVGLAGDVAFVGETGFFQFLGPADSIYGQVRVYAMSDQPWSFVDAALAATPGSSPCLVGSGALEPDSVAALAIEHGPPLAPAAIVLGGAAAGIPFKGGLLVPLPQLMIWITVSATGDAFVSGRWPAHVPSGFELWAQVWMLDDGGPQGFSATNAVHAIAP
ncbi:MAG TPA: hypothetical protein VFD43_12195 [Planctomycetota bacterium]|nr:hypothetical protein [Planctomycetota bacterium]